MNSSLFLFSLVLFCYLPLRADSAQEGDKDDTFTEKNVTCVLLILFQFFLTTRKEVLRSHLEAEKRLRTSLILKISETILSGIGCLKVSREATRFRLNITDAFTILSLASNKMPPILYFTLFLIYKQRKGIYIIYAMCLKHENDILIND